MADTLLKTPLHALHLELGARMVPFAGYDMPVQYTAGVMKEHLHTRAAAGLFDVSHMGQVLITGANTALDLERLVPQSIDGIKENRQRYAFFTNAAGGIEDDIMVTNRGDHLYVVLNAACKAGDIALLRAGLQDSTVVELNDRALLALQGPQAEAALSRICPVEPLAFMASEIFATAFGELWVSRSGYSGEDGFEISVPSEHADAFARALLAMDEVEPIGLGARDSLRLEAGLCLYGNDINTKTDPVQANLTWAIQKARREGGEREGGFPGESIILPKLSQPADEADCRRVGIRPEGRAPMREHVALFENETDEAPIGQITSAAFGPTVGHPIAMGYVPARLSAPGTRIWGEVRGKRLPAEIVALPFRPSTYKR